MTGMSQSFEYMRPGGLAEVFEALSSPEAVCLSGGTDLLVGIKHRKIRPGVVVDLKSVEEIPDTIESDDGVIMIGARVVMSTIVADPHINTHFPVLARAASVVGSVQIRNRATLAGNLCNASPAADTAPALLAHGAQVVVSGIGGQRSIPLDRFFLAPGTTALERGEVVTVVEVPIPESRTGSAFSRVTRRRGVDLASVSVACVVDTNGDVRFGFGAVGPTALLATARVEDLADENGWDRLLSIASPISDVRAGADYRRAMLGVHSRRALESALAQLSTGGRP